MKKIKIALIAVLAAAGGYTLLLPAATPGFGAFSNVRASAVRMPFYREGKLEFYVRSNSAALRGKQLDTVLPVIDIIRKDTTAETVAESDCSANVYGLNATLEEVEKYWKNRAYSDGVLISDNASLDQITKIISSKNKVFLRTPLMDLDGIGFSADMSRQVITVNSKVKIVLRNDGSQSLGSPLDTMSGKKAEKGKTSVSRVYCDELTMDVKRDLVILVGHVRVIDAAGTITAERLELQFESEPGKAQPQAGDVPLLESSGKRVKSAKFLGKVRAVRALDDAEAANGEQYAVCDVAYYDLITDTLELAGSRPRMSRGNDFAQADKIIINPEKKFISFHGNCVFSARQAQAPAGTPPDVVKADYADWDYPGNLVRLIGNADLKSVAEKAHMQSDRLEITLKDAAPAPGTEASGNDMFSSANSKEVVKAAAIGHVRMERNNNAVVEKASADMITYVADGRKIVMNGSPYLQRGGDSIKGGSITYFMDNQRLWVGRGSNIVLSPETIGSANMDIQGSQNNTVQSNSPVTIASENADLNYGGNYIAFAQKVRVRGRGMELDSERLDIYLKDAPDAKPVAKTDKNSDIFSQMSGSKQPVRAVASGKVRAKDAKGLLLAEKVEVFFSDKLTPGKVEPSRFVATGNVHAEDPSGKLQAGKLEIFFGNKLTPGKLEVEKLIAENQLHVENKPDTSGQKTDKSKSLLGGSSTGITSLDANSGVIDLISGNADFYKDVAVKDEAVALNCGHLQIKTRRVDPGDQIPTLESFKANDEFPSRLAVGEGRELVEIMAEEKVRMRRKLPTGEVQRASGDKAVYVVRDRKVVMTSIPPNRTQAVADGSGMAGDKVVIDLDTEELEVENGDVLTTLEGLDF